MTTPEANRPLTGDDVKLLKAGDRLKVVNGDSFLRQNGYPDGALVTFRAVDGIYVEIAELHRGNGSCFHRFQFVSRPTQPEPERDAVERLTILAGWGEVREATFNAPAEGHPGERNIGWRISLDELKKVDGLGLSGPTFLLSSAPSDLRTVLSLLSTAERQRDEAVRLLRQAADKVAPLMQHGEDDIWRRAKFVVELADNIQSIGSSASPDCSGSNGIAVGVVASTEGLK